jgi:phosphoesterase RecJ-like protein
MNNLLSEIKDKTVLITGHVNPDGDALGSALAFALLLKKHGISSDVSFDIKNALPTNLNHLPFEFITENVKEKYDKVYVFDCGNSSRLGTLENIVLNSNHVTVVDHHINPTFGDLQIIDSKAASTTQVLFREFKKLNLEIDSTIATCLMTGLITDTGRFQYSNTTSEVFQMASELMSYGANLTLISENIYGTLDLNAMKLQSEVINRINVFESENLVVSFVLQSDYERFNIPAEETDFLIDTIRLVKNSEVALLLKEQEDNSFKGSLRSRKLIDVQKIASTFGGGGHKAASGFSTNLDIESCTTEIRNEIKQQL